jgi:uncharacterized RDD family membrane protein YckC
MDLKKPQQIAITNAILASSGQRLSNYLLDMIIYNVINVLPLAIGWLLYSFLGNEELYFWLEGLNPVVDFLISYIIIVIYYTILESLTGRSVAKYITNTKVLMADGSTPTSSDIFKRSLCRLIPFDQLSFLGTIPKGWHDTISKTVVVDLKKYGLELEMRDAINEIGQE